MSDLVSPAPLQRFVLLVGFLLMGLSLVGYATVADDLRHVGEFAGVSSLLLAGLALIGDAYGVMARWLALRWVALGTLLGAIAGTPLDATVAGFCVGLAAGVVVALFRAGHRRTA